MLRLLALLLPLLQPPARAREPSAQDVSLGVVSAGVRRLRSATELREGSRGLDFWVQRRLGTLSKCPKSDRGWRLGTRILGFVTEGGDWGPEFLDSSGG